MTTHDELLARLPEAEHPQATPVAPRTLVELHAEQQALYEQERQREQARRDACPDAQWPEWGGTALRATLAAYDPTPELQQAEANRYRAAHADAALRRYRYPGDTNPTTDVGEHIYAWREQQGQAGWQRAVSWVNQVPPCAVCGDPSDGQAAIGSHSRMVCARCRPSVHAAHAANVSEELVADGRTRTQAAHDLVASLLAPGQKAS